MPLPDWIDDEPITADDSESGLETEAPPTELEPLPADNLADEDDEDEVDDDDVEYEQ